ncbi:MAG: vitamin B12-dependent ribonucleotide reductase [Acidimicrobiales bacterium]
MSLTDNQVGLGLTRVNTTAGVDPYDDVEWGLRDARITDYRDGSVAFEQLGVEFPVSWSVNASNIVAQKYFRGGLGTEGREWSLRQVVDRVVDTIAGWGDRDGYFVDDAERDAFSAELKHLLVHQKAAFNSPVWFNIGVEGVPNQGSACFILSVDDSIDSILDWYREEGVIFKGGSGAGVNLSKVRASVEHLSGGGTPSGPVSFMRGADASAGTIKSGGKTRRAAKMVILDVDHPDIADFVTCKAREERKARALRDAGFEMDLDGADSHSIQYQNANNSVRVTDEFMSAVLSDSEWPLIARTDGSVTSTVSARELMRTIATAAWECADPGIQYDTTINRWNTAANTGRINASNPCSEYMHLDDSACNLASLNLLSFLRDDDTFDDVAFQAAVQVVFIAQEIIVGNADYPTEKIGTTTRRFRQLGLGYTNLGALLMALGHPYDSDAGRAWAAAITALMTGHAYATSARVSARMGPFAGFHENRDPMLRVLEMHRAEVAHIDEELVPSTLLGAAQTSWDLACQLGQTVGVRNSQATVLAPTGTISFMMDADTTGIEPDLGLVKTKKLVGGGTMSIVNQTVPRALRQMGFDDEQAAEIVAYIAEHHSVVGAPHLGPEHLPVFACSMGDNVVHYGGHLKMMAATQPFLSGAISKTVNTPEATTVEEIEQIYIDGWKLGLKAVAVYRDNCKVGQPLSTGKSSTSTASTGTVTDAVSDAVESLVPVAHVPVRERMPRRRSSRTFEFRVADCKGFVTVGEYDDGRPGELFVRVSKQGSTLAGIMDAFAIAVSHGLQYGVPLQAYVAAFVGMRFEPAGMTDDPDLRLASSLMDYLFRRLALDYLSYDERAAMGLFSVAERTQPTLPGVEEAATVTNQGNDLVADPPSRGVDRRCACSAAWACSAPGRATCASSAAPPAAAADPIGRRSRRLERPPVDRPAVAAPVEHLVERLLAGADGHEQEHVAARPAGRLDAVQRGPEAAAVVGDDGIGDGVGAGECDDGGRGLRAREQCMGAVGDDALAAGGDVEMAVEVGEREAGLVASLRGELRQGVGPVEAEVAEPAVEVEPCGIERGAAAFVAGGAGHDDAFDPGAAGPAGQGGEQHPPDGVPALGLADAELGDDPRGEWRCRRMGGGRGDVAGQALLVGGDERDARPVLERRGHGDPVDGAGVRGEGPHLRLPALVAEPLVLGEIGDRVEVGGNSRPDGHRHPPPVNGAGRPPPR